ncbi:hypothetical protein CKG00_09080 [Morganella morganii]|uniref:Uncharacterized protein n=1 Tax=Morganella morganii TaxID=582 RepID=A0A433ZWP3_MORMO|nr:hypothetical protein CKG00_09080 [Morganella morganii]
MLEKIKNNLVSKICYLSSGCILNNDNRITKTEGNYITPPHYILDATLLGSEHVELQKLLSKSLNIPPPVTGQHNTHHGILVTDTEYIYQTFELNTFKHRISQQLDSIPINLAMLFNEQIKETNSNKEGLFYFPVYHFPDDACFVIKRSVLEQFIHTFHLQQTASSKTSTRLSTPVSRLLWLACKHNDTIGSLIEQPYKLLSVFEQWAAIDGITDRFSAETLKTALERGSLGESSTPV